jgi:hypothetical protein
MKALLLGLLLALSAAAGAAETASDGELLYQRGERAFRNKQWEEARRAFAAAYELDRKPELLYDVAIATWRLARAAGTPATLRAAHDAYARYLAEAPEGRSRKQAQQALALIETELGPDSATDSMTLPPSPDDARRPLDPYAPVPATPRGRAAEATPPPGGNDRAAVDKSADSRTNPAPSATTTKSPGEPPKPSASPKWAAPVAVVAVLVVVALAVGLGVGLSTHSGTSSVTASGLAIHF